MVADEQKIEETLTQRGGTYGDFRDNARISQNIKKAMQDSPNWQVLPPYIKEGLELIALKMSRILSGDPLYGDNPHDIIGYAKLIEDRAAQDREAGVVIPSPGDPMYPTYEHTPRGNFHNLDSEFPTAASLSMKAEDTEGTALTPSENPHLLHLPGCDAALMAGAVCDMNCWSYNPREGWVPDKTEDNTPI